MLPSTRPLSVRLIIYRFSHNRKDCKQCKMAQQKRKPLSLCNYIFIFWGGWIFVYCQNVWCQGLIKECSNSCHQQIYNIPCKATDVCNSSLPLAALISHYIMENTSPGISRHRLTAICGRGAHCTESKH